MPANGKESVIAVSFLHLRPQAVDELNSRLLRGVRLTLESLEVDPGDGPADVLRVGKRIPRSRFGNAACRKLDQPLQGLVRGSPLDGTQQAAANVFQSRGATLEAPLDLPETVYFGFARHLCLEVPKKDPKSGLPSDPGHPLSMDNPEALEATQHCWVRSNKWCVVEDFSRLIALRARGRVPGGMQRGANRGGDRHGGASPRSTHWSLIHFDEAQHHLHRDC